MSLGPKISTLFATVIFAFPVYASDIMINDAYVRTAMKGAKSGAAFMQIMNHTAKDDRVISVASDIAKRVELHTHKDMGEGVMRTRCGLTAQRYTPAWGVVFYALARPLQAQA